VLVQLPLWSVMFSPSFLQPLLAEIKPKLSGRWSGLNLTLTGKSLSREMVMLQSQNNNFSSIFLMLFIVIFFLLLFY
jgi:hypothetical protein